MTVYFPHGIAGFESFEKYILVQQPESPRRCVLAACDPGGPRFALVQRSMPPQVGKEELDLLGAKSPAELRAYSMITRPLDGRTVTAALCAPILIHPETGRGVQVAAGTDAVRKSAKDRASAGRGSAKEAQSAQRKAVTLFLEEGAALTIGDTVRITCCGVRQDGSAVLGVDRPEEAETSRKEKREKQSHGLSVQPGAAYLDSKQVRRRRSAAAGA